jgi:acetyl-CoA carboxylase biotin carboxyl carrier protein
MSDKAIEQKGEKNIPAKEKNSKIAELTTLMELMKSFDVTDLEIADTDTSIRLSRAQPMMAAPVQMMTSPVAAATPLASSPSPTPPAETAITGHAVKSPMVGTVYLSASPEADNFVKVGQNVSVGDVLCLVEAMKMFNQIEADKSGVLKACLVKSGEPVEFDHPLFIIE